MNINTDNYEAYLLDYVEGNLSPKEAAQLRQFVAAQGLDWDELTSPLPHLEAPQIAFEGKSRLKKNRAVVPLYVKIASAAAAAGLLFTVGLWTEKQLPTMEPIAELKPITAKINVPQLDITDLPSKPTAVIKPKAIVKEQRDIMPQRVEMPQLAELQPIKASETQIDQPITHPIVSDFDLLTYKISTELAFTQISDAVLETFEYESNLSLVSRGLLKLTGGRHDSFASLLFTGLSHAKQKAEEAATDIALNAYYRADEHFEDVKERWKEKNDK